MNILLSICIPTYNRLDYLLDNLSHLLPQINRYKEEVELIISDNHSPTDPCQQLRELGDKFGVVISYYRQQENIGVDRNIEYVTKKATGDYLYILGDDDVLSPSFLDIVLPILKTHEFGAIHYGRLVGDENCSNNKLHNPLYKDTYLKFSANEFIKECLSTPNLLSSIIVEKECWDRGIQKVNKEYYGYNWFANCYYGIIEISKPCLLYYFPLLLMRNPQRGWAKFWPLYSVVGLSDLFFDLDKLVPGVYNLWIKRLHDVRFYNLTLILMQVYSFRDFYRKNKYKFYPHLNKYERAYFNYWLYTPIPRISDMVVMAFQRLKRIFEKTM